ncbi:MAG: efflux RND transporter periplasmic adaptor subunit [Verrucomicrobiota bacterium]
MKKVLIAIVLLVVVIGALAGIKILQIRKLMAAGKAFRPPPETISSAVAREEKWQTSLSAIASLAAAQGVNVTTEIPGTVREIAFDSGAVVTNGQLLLRLDTSSEEAQLRALDAQVDLARVNAERLRQLLASKTISQAEVDSSEAALKQNQANADNIRATVAKKTIRAPFAGRLGIRLVNLGQFQEAGKPIVSLQSLEPMHADFTMTQQTLAQLTNGMRVRLFTDTYPSNQFAGTLTAINPDLDAATRSVKLQATFENKDHLLRPGMFARVEVVLPGEQDVLVIPATSILSAPFGDSVYVIEQKPAGTNGPAGLVARQQFIRTGRVRGDFVSVDSGLKSGEKVASSGVFKLRNGVGVVENNELSPKPKLSPKPSDS